MRVKQSPEDFQVEEILDFTPGRQGHYFIHRLKKRKMDTLHALHLVAREARIDSQTIGCAGLKDRQGVTIQYISIPGKRVKINWRDLNVQLIGRTDEPISPKCSQGNAFRLVLRALRSDELETLERNVPDVRTSGAPNYFDDQRFGCVRHGQGFILRPLLAGRPNEALKSLLAVPSPFEKSGRKSIKAALDKAWGDWETCRKIGKKLGCEAVFRHLSANPGDLFGALRKIPQSLRLIHLYAFQSYLWNKALSECMLRWFSPQDRCHVQTEIGNMAAHRSLSPAEQDSWLQAELPLPAGDLVFPEEGKKTQLLVELAGAMHQVLQEENLRMEDLRVPKAAGMSFKAEPRRVLVVPKDLKLSSPVPDKDSPGGFQVNLSFRLPRGSYATMVVKRLTAMARR